MKSNSYLLKLFYKKKIDLEYKTHEFLLQATPNAIDDMVKEEIEIFNNNNEQYGYLVEHYNLFMFVKGE